jgi:long-subunit fatty acid transport protein
MRTILVIFITICTLLEIQAQAIKRPGQQPAPAGNFNDKLWYGGGFNLGFSGSGFVSLFQLGVSPMVGYKITPQWSVGPRVSFTYSYYSARTLNGNLDIAQPISYGGGLFMRYKIIPNIFIHSEVEAASQANVVRDFNQLVVQRWYRENVYLGAGYTSGNPGGFGYELLLLYNINQPNNFIESPFDIRFGFNFRF